MFRETIMIKTGLENFLEKIDTYKGGRAALIANQTSVTSGLNYSWNVLKKRGVDLIRIFSPEHGMFAVEQDQIAVGKEPEIGCEVVSLYGASFSSLLPDKAYLADIDLVLFDIQDVGSRYYTYVNTMALFMKEISGMGKEFVVLDRPNALGGLAVEGPDLNKEYESFVGAFNVPVRHGMTAGELALLYAREHRLDIDLKISRMQGWKREMFYKDTGLPWIPPSPNMPTEYTAHLYPGMCLLEGTNLSEGRGTTMPFVNVGAPYVDAYEFAHALNSLDLSGVYFRPVFFKPTFNKFSGQTAQGVYLHITDINEIRSFAIGVAVVKTACDLYKDNFQFAKGVYEFNDKYPAFDLLAGSSRIREMILDGAGFDDIVESWAGDEEEFAERRLEYLLY